MSGYWLSWPVGFAAFVVMPAGPWYRQLLAALLLVMAADLRRRDVAAPGR